MRGAERGTPVMETERLRLRPRVVDDADALFPSLSDPDFMTYWSNAPHDTIEQVRENFRKTSPDWRAWAVTLKGDDTAIGVVSAGERRQGEVTELGYMIAKHCWGQGIAAEAVSRVIDRVLIEEDQRRVFADTDPDNRMSRKLLERLGFQLEGLLRDEWETHIGVRDTTLYGLLRAEWVARREAERASHTD